VALAAVLFDLDGTLVDTLPICYLAFRGALEGAGAPTLTDAEIHALFGPSEEGMMQRVLPENWERVLPAYFEEYRRLLASCPAVVPELVDALALLRERRIRTALVTGKSRVTAIMSVQHFRLDDAFEAIECGSPQGVVKADAIRRLVERWHVSPADAVYVGDGAADMVAAREAGVLAAGAAWAHGVRVADLKDARADVIFADAREFLAWLDAATGGVVAETVSRPRPSSGPR
jgi:phosphoglycolate phosphatase-like HAD superfamily hydrolase